MELLLLSFAGLGAGLVAGLVGLAGGIVIVPVLTWMYGPEALHSAIVISWFSVLFNSFSAAAKQWRVRTPPERAALLHSARWYLAGAVLVAPAVAALASTHTSAITPGAVAVLQLCLAAVMLWPVDELPRPRIDKPARDASFGGLIAGVSTLIGVGGGTYTIAYFVYGAGARFRDAIATANMTGFAVGALSVLGYLASLLLYRVDAADAFGPISTLGMVAVVAFGVIAAPVGVRISHALPTRALRHILIVALCASALRLLVS
jgi:uncharacterized protein